ncbi:beta-1,3-galactosyltransferase 5-like isoform X1 [Schistocerca cancellata]|uniref:beta-1,3-galactosyltransferase 5-like isoform X1 n=1 Tax=Schistocerca cancellata TaxID=274614 RepID=UPI0021197614|nr:beta-1,3-galactosyltransferase 5-like isoform X1 [Schistocerca cancellata]XP_049781075.1 beta-1,3-galactosyltransferase 5-like isoform X1 [Schistocerca cancellata]XP_049781076.1 beta-1,3-galactosyltransferase 5-like isoform X1 [Schistocerca cancellata]
MAFRVRKSHSLLLGLVGIVLIMYSAYYSNSGYLFVENGPRNRKAANITAPDGSVIVEVDASKNNIAALKVSKNAISTAASRVVSVPMGENSTHNTTLREAAKQPKPVANTAAAEKSAPNVKAATKPNNSDPADKAVVTSTIFDAGYFITNENLCIDDGQNLQILIIITSAPAHFEARMAIRQTWGSFKQRKDVAMSFLIGSVQDNKTNQTLATESDMYGDIIMAQFFDTYNNLTLKTLSMLEWVDSYCSKIKFVLKTDDDMFINIPRLLSFVSKHSKDKRTIFGRLAKRWKPIRNKKSKYYVSPNQYRPSVFPDFTTGPAYLLTGDVVHDLYATALNKTYLKLEDVFMTGIVAQDRKVKRTHANEFMNKRITFNPCAVQKVISIHMVKFHEQFDLWKKLLDGRSKCT